MIPQYVTLGIKCDYMCTLEDISEEVKPLEDAKIPSPTSDPAITGNTTLTRHKRQVLSLPCRLGGLGIGDPTDIADQHYRRLL